MTAVEPRHLLDAARKVGDPSLSLLDGRWQVTGAALARQAIELAVEHWLADRGIDNDRVSFRAQFVLVRSLHDDPALGAELYNTWSTLSEACHASSYERPPTAGELLRSFQAVDRFLISIAGGQA